MWPRRREKRRWSLATRILAVNLLPLLMLAGALFYLDSLRVRLTEQRLAQTQQDLILIADALHATPTDQDAALMLKAAQTTDSRIRQFDVAGNLGHDTFALGPETYTLRDPAQQGWQKIVARTLDRANEFAVGADPVRPFREAPDTRATSWNELQNLPAGQTRGTVTLAPDRTPMITAGLTQADGSRLLLTTNARDITRLVRAERFNLGIVLGLALIASVLLSRFLGRTIARPLRRLADAAVAVRQGRARDVTVPRLPSRTDEIGQLARALSDMTQNLRERIDAGEHFAADVTHELKNPLASLRSAIDGMGTVSDPALRAQLLTIAAEDVQRLDRLVTDISEASRVDAELSRTRFEPIDMGVLIGASIDGWRNRISGKADAPSLAFARPLKGTAVVAGEPGRLERVIDNLIANALSFAQPRGLVHLSATRSGDVVIIRVVDDGPGVAPAMREVIFRRFYSDRDGDDAFGKHSGLGLAIARTIIEAHQGSIAVVDRDPGERGAAFEIRLPAIDS